MNGGVDPRLWSVVLAQADGDTVSVRHVSAAIIALTGVDGLVAVLATGGTQRETVYAADDMATRLEELTLTLGEGPGVDAVRTGESVLTGDIGRRDAQARWPVFARAAVDIGVGAVFSLPLRVGAIRLGVLTLYRCRAGELTPDHVVAGLALADVVCLMLLDRLDPAGQATADWAARSDGVSHPEVHQATGMLIVQLGVTAEIAFARLRAHAFAHNRRLRDVARDVVTRRLRFKPDSGHDYADGH